MDLHVGEVCGARYTVNCGTMGASLTGYTSLPPLLPLRGGCCAMRLCLGVGDCWWNL